MAIYWNSDRVRRYMKKKGIRTPAELARFIGTSKPTAGRILAGEELDKIPAAILESLAVAFQLEPGSFLRTDAITSRSPDPASDAAGGSGPARAASR